MKTLLESLQALKAHIRNDSVAIVYQTMAQYREMVAGCIEEIIHVYYSGLNCGRDNILLEIIKERHRQDEKWGEQNHLPIEWVAILTEEVGEVSKEALEVHFDDHYQNRDRLYRYKEELIQVAAVAVSMIESIERFEKNGYEFLNKEK